MIKSLLITGSTGMVGRNVIEYFERNSKYQLFAPRHTELDLLNYSSVSSYIAQMKPDMIIHCAGVVGGIQANIANPVKFLVDNAQMGQNIVLAAQANHVLQLLNLGSSCMYPRNAPNPLTEEMILTGQLEPTNEGYALAKIMTAKLCSYISQTSPLKYKTLIPCNLYGKYDKFDPEKSHMIPSAIRKVAAACRQNAESVEIWGDGTARREFMYAEDLADAIAFVIEHFDEIPDLLNVGLGHDYTINEYYHAVAEVVGFKGEFEHDTTKPVGMKQKLVCTQKLSHLGWQPKHNLISGLTKTYQYYMEHYS